MGFVNVHERDYKAPIEEWPKHAVYKEATKWQMKHYELDLEGW